MRVSSVPVLGYQELGWWGVQLLPRFSHQPGPISKPRCIYSSSQPTLGCLTGISSFQGLYRAPSGFSSPATSPIFSLLSSQARNFGVFRCLFFHIPQPVCQVLSQQRLQTVFWIWSFLNQSSQPTAMSAQPCPKSTPAVAPEPALPGAGKPSSSSPVADLRTQGTA